MAKQAGPFFLNRTIGNLCFYHMEGRYYARKKSSLTAKRVKTSPRFRRTMEYAQMMGCSSKIGSAVFKALPERFKESWMYRAFVGEAMGMFKRQMAYGEVFAVLWQRYALEFVAGYAEEKEFRYVLHDERKASFAQHSAAPVYRNIAIRLDNKIIGPYPFAGRQRKTGRHRRARPLIRGV